METALITGASTGIGKAFAEELAARNTNLILVARSETKLLDLAQKLSQQFSIQTEIIVQDLSLPRAASSVFEELKTRGLEVDFLINNAGFGDYGPLLERDLTKQLEMIQVNITALVELTYLCLGPMVSKKQGKIINVASIAAFQSLPYLSTYSSTKAFVLSFTEALWAENRDKGVKILALCPGPTESEFFTRAEFPTTQVNNNKYTPALEVVKDALEALSHNQSCLVTGGLGNQIIVNIGRFLPREFLLNTVEKQFRPK